MIGSRGIRRRGTLLAIVLALASSAPSAPRYKILHAFGHGSDGSGPWGRLVFDARGERVRHDH